MTRWNEITKQQFQLSYFGTIPYEASQHMSSHEREYFFGLLREQKDAERAAQEEALKAAKQARSSTPKKPRKARRSRR